jgi:hypothetical protein
MPRLNNAGQAACGVGDNIASYDKKVVASKDSTGFPAGGTSWIDDTTLIYQTYAQADGHPILETFDTVTSKRTTVSDLGANDIAAGGGRWVAWLDNGTGLYGDLVSPIAGIGSVGRDGTIAIIPDRQEGFGFKLYAPDGRITTVPSPEVAFGLFVVGPTQAIWNGPPGQGFHTLNLFVPVQTGDGSGPKLLTVNGEDWVMYWSERFGLITHPTHTLEGYVLETRPIAFNYDAVSVDGRFIAAWSNTTGERPQDLVSAPVNLTLPRTRFNTSGSAPQPPGSPAPPTFTAAAVGGGPVANSATSILVQAQLGLLEDDIVYRLSLLAVNVLQPLKNRYPNAVVKSGFHQVNSGVSQHELGEAVDIQIVNQTPELLYEVANWMQNNLPFDQLVLCYTTIGNGQPWIHVSFSPASLRQHVTTKDFDDTFYDGLFFIQPLTGEEAAQALRDQADLDARILDEMKKISKRAGKLTGATSVQDEAPAATTTTPGTSGPGGSGGSGGGGTTGNAAIVACVQRALNLTSAGPADASVLNNQNAVIAFEIVKRVAWLLKDSGCGLLIAPPSGENVVTWNGYYFRAGRVCFPDGQIYKILTGVEDGPAGGGHAPQWSDNGIVDSGLYVPAMDPGSDINLNWLQCGVTPPANTTNSTGNTTPGNTGGGQTGGGTERDPQRTR